MKNQWLTRFRVGKKVRYKGLDKELKDKEGTVVRISGPVASWSQTGVSSDNSDMDLYGFAIPKKEVLFPNLAGHVLVPVKNEGRLFEVFGKRPVEMFAQWQQHGVVDESACSGNGRIYDFTVFNIVKYFDLLLDNNPNIIDSIYTPTECVLHLTQVGVMMRENRDIFLHKGCFAKFKGYAYSQLHKMTSREPVGKRKKIREEFGFDVKFGYHLVRLLNECEQVLMNGTLDLRLNNEHLKAIRRGEVPEADIRRWASDKEKQLEALFTKSELPNKPDEGKIVKLLMECLDYHYGNLKECVMPDRYKQTLEEVKALIFKAGI